MFTMQQPSIALVDYFNLVERMKVFKPRFKDLILEWDIKNGVAP